MLLARGPSPYEVLNDLDGEVYNFWRVLRELPEDLRELLTMTPYSRDEYLDCRDRPSEGLSDLERARRFFTRANLAFNASTSTVGYSSGSFGHSPKPTAFATKVDRLAAIAERLRSVEVENMDALKLIDRWDNEDVALYLDPPYLDEVRVNVGDYATDNGSLAFHENLVERLRTFRGTAVLSGYAHPLYDTLGWTRVDIEVQAGSSGSGRRTECLWVNV